jgi:hypothetical protein
MRHITLILAALALAVAAPALADKGGNPSGGGNSGENGNKGGNGGGGNGGGKPGGGTGTMSLVLLDSTDGVPHFGQKVTFDVSTDATTYPWVTLKCFQNGSQVYQASRGIFPTSLGQEFTLGPTPSWQGGDADCTAFLEDWDSYSKRGSIQTLASMSFHVYA